MIFFVFVSFSILVKKKGIRAMSYPSCSWGEICDLLACFGKESFNNGICCPASRYNFCIWAKFIHSCLFPCLIPIQTFFPLTWANWLVCKSNQMERLFVGLMSCIRVYIHVDNLRGMWEVIVPLKSSLLKYNLQKINIHS